MASSKVMASSTSRNSDRRRRSSSSVSTKSSSISVLDNQNSHDNHQRQGRNSCNDKNNNCLASMTVDGLLRNVYGDNQAAESTLLEAEITLLDAAGAVTAISDNEANGGRCGGTTTFRRQESSVSNSAMNKTVDDAWKEIVAGGRQCKQEASDDMMTLEDFLAKAGAVEEEDVKVEPVLPPTERLSGGIFAFDPMPQSTFPSQQSVDGVVGFGNGVEVIGGRGKRRTVLEPLDKAAQQRQRRMIKNRESAARSRERKQAYQIELEYLAVKLEEENEQLLKEKAERTRERFKQLMKKVVPIVEKRRPPRILRRVHSMQW